MYQMTGGNGPVKEKEKEEEEPTKDGTTESTGFTGGDGSVKEKGVGS